MHVYITDRATIAYLHPGQRLIFELPDPDSWTLSFYGTATSQDRKSLVYVAQNTDKGRVLTATRAPCDSKTETCTVNVIVFVAFGNDWGTFYPPSDYTILNH